MEEKNINNTGNENSATEHEFLDKKTHTICTPRLSARRSPWYTVPCMWQ